MPVRRFTKEALIGAVDPVFTYRVKARFQDVDAAGIVFFPRILGYFHDVYVAYLEDQGWPLHLTLENENWIAPIAHSEADYLRPVKFGYELDSGIVLARIEETQFTLGYRLTRAESGEVMAVGQTVHVFVNKNSFKRLAVPGGLRTAFSRFSSGEKTGA